ncbi:MAG: hypothetical protein NC917_01680 [Candidatus Omnitrophica bacterium]|nr:hypothetical protein [Candidatus Omnitrophota bacterium]MCM8810342.1 hypothetical protein [Candidatus Omnitrophota bacterium]
MENIRKIKIISISFFLYPLLLILIGKIIVLNGFFSNFAISYEENEKIKILLNALYFLGLGVFFFCGGFSGFISKKLFVNKKNDFEKSKAYFSYTILMLSFLNTISTFGFIGFLICRNFAWLGTFSLINFLSLFSYFPTYKRFIKKLETFS